jgi:hypothetical protein
MINQRNRELFIINSIAVALESHDGLKAHSEGNPGKSHSECCVSNGGGFSSSTIANRIQAPGKIQSSLKRSIQNTTRSSSSDDTADASSD